MSLYRVLGLAPAASKEEVRAAYKRQALAAHPDKGGSKEAFHAVTRAFETLYDDAARVRYDGRLSRSGRTAGARPSRPESAAAPAAGPPGPAAARPAAAEPSPRRPPACAGSGVGEPAAGPSGSAAASSTRSAAAAPVDGPQAASAEAQGRGQHSPDPMKHLGLEGVLERLQGLLRRLSSETRRRVLETRLTHLQRRALEQWMGARQAAQTSATAGVGRDLGDSALAEVEAAPSSSSGSDLGDSSESECAMAALEGLPQAEAAAEEADCAGTPREAEVGMDDGDQEEGNEAFGEDEDMKLPWLQRSSRRQRDGSRSYCARMYIHGLIFMTKSVHLAAALDFHVAFMTVRERMPPTEAVDASSIQSTVLRILDEQGLHVERDVLRMAVASVPACMYIYIYFFVCSEREREGERSISAPPLCRLGVASLTVRLPHSSLFCRSGHSCANTLFRRVNKDDIQV